MKVARYRRISGAGKASGGKKINKEKLYYWYSAIENMRF